MSSPAASASTNTALYASPTPASGCVAGIIAGCTRTLTVSPPSGRAPRSQIARSLTTAFMALADATSAAVTPVMPSRWTSAARTLLWKARLARIAAFAAASKPSTAAAGSASASRGVEALEGRGRIGLGVAERLCLLDGLREAHPGGVHLVEDVVGGAVDDAEHALHAVAGEGLAQRAEQGDGAGHGGLEVEVDAGGVRRLVQRRPVLGEQGLVGGDHGCATGHRLEQQRAGRLDASDDLDDEVDILDQARGVRREERGVHVQPPAPARTPDGDAGQLERSADALGEFGRVRREVARHLRADHTTPEQG